MHAARATQSNTVKTTTASFAEQCRMSAPVWKIAIAPKKMTQTTTATTRRSTVNYYNEFDPKAAAWLRELINRN